MKVHIIGDLRCHICKIRFTRNSLAHHNRVFHPELELKIPVSVKAARKVPCAVYILNTYNFRVCLKVCCLFCLIMLPSDPLIPRLGIYLVTTCLTVVLTQNDMFNLSFAIPFPGRQLWASPLM